MKIPLPFSWGITCLLGVASVLADDVDWRKFSFGTGRPPSGFVKVLPSTIYQPAGGFGFESGEDIVAQADSVSSGQPFLFSVKVPEGNYRVRIALGDVAGPSTTTVKAEARRLLLENVRTVAGETVTRDIMVNIRTPHIGPDREVRLKQREKEEEWISWDEKLTLEFNGERPCLRSIEVAPVRSVPTVFLAGDSTVCDQALEPWNSWGQMLPRFFEPGVAVANHAESGESIRSSLGARRFEKIFSLMKPGDWLLVQFGHNDMKDRAEDALATYQTNLKRIVAQTRAKGGTPVLITSMERKSGVKAPTLAGYPEAVREVAREEGVALVDLNAMSGVLYRALGPDLDQAFQDGTHHNNYGSYLLAQCVAAGIESAGLRLADFLVADVKDFDPAQPEAIGGFSVPSSAMHSRAKPEGN